MMVILQIYSMVGSSIPSSVLLFFYLLCLYLLMSSLVFPFLYSVNSSYQPVLR